MFDGSRASCTNQKNTGQSQAPIKGFHRKLREGFVLPFEERGRSIDKPKETLKLTLILSQTLSLEPHWRAVGLVIFHALLDESIAKACREMSRRNYWATPIVISNVPRGGRNDPSCPA